MKKTLVIVLIFTINFLFAQKELSKDYSYTVSEPYKVFDGLKKYFSKNNQTIAIKFGGKEVVIQKFDSEKPAFVSEKSYQEFFPKNYQIESTLKVGNKYYVFYSSWNGDDDKEQLFSVEVDFEKGEFMSPKLLFQVNGKVTGTNIGYYVMDKFTILQSFDTNKILVQYRKKPEVKRDTKSFDIIGLAAFDTDLKEISNKEVKMPYTERRMNNIDYQLDNDGNLYLLAKVFHDDSNDDKKSRKDEEANYHIELLTLKVGAKDFLITKFDNKNKFISKLWLFDSPENYLVCGGFYSNGKGDLYDSDGILAFKIDKNGTIYDNVYHDIPLELINQYVSNKTKKKNDKKERDGDEAKFSDLVLKDFIFNKDGSIILVGEQTFVTEIRRQSMNGFSRSSYIYHFNDILVAKIGTSGELNWMKKIPKKQQTGTSFMNFSGGTSQGGMSYKYFSANNHHYLVFLDNVKNINLAIDKAPALHLDGQGGYLTAVKIADSDGSLTKSSILNGRDLEDFQMHQFSVDRVLKTSENSFMLEVYKKKKEDVMIKVVMK